MHIYPWEESIMYAGASLPSFFPSFLRMKLMDCPYPRNSLCFSWLRWIEWKERKGKTTSVDEISFFLSYWLVNMSGKIPYSSSEGYDNPPPITEALSSPPTALQAEVYSYQFNRLREGYCRSSWEIRMDSVSEREIPILKMHQSRSLLMELMVR